MDDVDLSRYVVGDVFELSERNARLLIAEGCAERVVGLRRTTDRRTTDRRTTDRRKEPREN